MKKVTLSLILFIYIFGSFTGCISNGNEKNNEPEYSINFVENSYIISETGYVNNNQTITINKLINTTNLTKIIFILTWIDDETGCFMVGDHIEIYIISPNDSKVEFIPTNSSYSNDQFGNISIAAKINTIPVDQDITKDQVSKFINKNGIGNWQINLSCKYVTQSLMGPPDMGNDWELKIFIYYYVSNMSKL